MNETNTYVDPEVQRPASRRLAINEIDLVQVLRDIWSGKYFIAALAVIGFVYALFSLAVASPTYTATMVVGPSEASATRAGAVPGQLAALSSSFGVNLSGNDASQFAKYKELLDSDVLAAVLLQREELRPLFFGRGWNPKTRMFERPKGIAFNIKNFVKGILGLHQWSTPTAFEMRTLLKTAMHSRTDKATGFVETSLDSETPDRAAALLRAVSSAADKLVRDRESARAISRIDYLENALQHTTVQDQREAIINILSAQQKNLMMASADATYAMEVIDPAYAPPVPTSPKPQGTIVSCVLMGAILAALAAVIYGQRARVWRNKGIAVKRFDVFVLEWVRHMLGRFAPRRVRAMRWMKSGT